MAKNRVWGFDVEKQSFIGASGWVSSTLQWGSGYRCDGMASVSTVQRYYASSYGRFNTADPMAGSARGNNPGSWNRYSYTLGDPVNGSDPRGLCVMDGNYNYWDTAPPDGVGSGSWILQDYGSGDCGGNSVFLSQLGSSGQATVNGYGFNSSGNNGGTDGLQVFANDLGSCSDATTCMLFAQGTGNNSSDSTSSGISQPPSCESKILTAVNSTFGTTFTSANITNEFQFSTGAPAGQGTLNLNISVPPSGQPSGISAGRIPISWWTYITGVGSTLHVPDGPGGADSSQTLPLSSNQFTVHIDSSFPYNPIGLLTHVILDMTPLGGYKACP